MQKVTILFFSFFIASVIFAELRPREIMRAPRTAERIVSESAFRDILSKLKVRELAPELLHESREIREKYARENPEKVFEALKRANLITEGTDGFLDATNLFSTLETAASKAKSDSALRKSIENLTASLTTEADRVSLNRDVLLSSYQLDKNTGLSTHSALEEFVSQNEFTQTSPGSAVDTRRSTLKNYFKFLDEAFSSIGRTGEDGKPYLKLDKETDRALVQTVTERIFNKESGENILPEITRLNEALSGPDAKVIFEAYAKLLGEGNLSLKNSYVALAALKGLGTEAELKTLDILSLRDKLNSFREKIIDPNEKSKFDESMAKAQEESLKKDGETIAKMVKDEVLTEQGLKDLINGEKGERGKKSKSCLLRKTLQAIAVSGAALALAFGGNQAKADEITQLAQAKLNELDSEESSRSSTGTHQSDDAGRSRFRIDRTRTTN